MARKKKSAEPEITQPTTGGFVPGATGSYIPALDDPMGKYDVNTSAEKVYKRNWLLRIVAIIVGVLLLLLSIGYACTAVINSAGRFTVSMAGNLYGIQLADNEDFENPTLQLYGSAVENMDNITKHWLLNHNNELGDDPVYKTYADIDKVYGDHNGTNYLAYTFAVRNGGQAADGDDAIVDYMASLEVVTAYKGADEAIRVMVFINGEPTVYAKPRVGTENIRELFAVDKNFVSDTTVMEYVRSNFEVGDVDRYTVVVWLEGEDPECVNDIMGGEVKLKMNLEVLERPDAE